MNVDSILKVVRGIVRLRGATDNTLIGNTGDALHVSLQDINILAELKMTNRNLENMTRAILNELRILNRHMECVTGLDDLELDPGDENRA